MDVAATTTQSSAPNTRAPGGFGDRADQVFFCLLCGVLALVPLAISTNLLYYDVTPKVVLTLVAGAIAAGWMAGGRYPSLDRRTAILAIAVAAHIAVLILCSVISEAPAVSFGGGLWRRFGLVSRLAAIASASVLFLLIRWRTSRWQWCLRAFCGTGLICAIYTIFQYFGVDPLISSHLYRDEYWFTLRPPSTMGHASYAATLYAQVMFWGLALTLNKVAPYDRVLGFATTAVTAFALVLCGTRAGLLGVLAGLVIIAPWSKMFKAWQVWVPLAIAVLAASTIFILPQGAPLRERVQELASDPQGGPRVMLWQASVRMGFVKPISGFGLETFTLMFPDYQSAGLAAAYPDHHHESPHNLFLDVGLEQGFLGLMAFLFLLVAAIRLGLSASHERRPLVLCTLASIVAALVAQQFTAFTLSTYLLLLCGLALHASLAEPGESPEGRARIRGAWIATAVAVFSLSYYYWDRDQNLADIDWLLRSGKAVEAIDVYHKMGPAPLLGESPDLWYSRRLMTSVPPGSEPHLRSRIWQDALEAAGRATQHSEERANAYFQSAVLSAMGNDSAKTEESLRGAILWAPQWYKPHWYLSKLLAKTGRGQDGETEAALAKSLSGGRTLE